MWSVCCHSSTSRTANLASDLWKPYRRKNVGYLWAIARGAKVVYDSVDDNLLLTETIRVLEPGYYAHYMANSSQQTINVYDTYGLPDVWPRGLPLEDVKTKAPAFFRKKFTLPLIQQGMQLPSIKSQLLH